MAKIQEKDCGEDTYSVLDLPGFGSGYGPVYYKSLFNLIPLEDRFKAIELEDEYGRNLLQRISYFFIPKGQGVA